MTGWILRDIVFDLCREGFVGHIAGDDFILVMPSEVVDVACRWIIKCFDAFIPYRFSEADRRQGYYEARNRRGELERFPLLSISIAVVINHNGEFESFHRTKKRLCRSLVNRESASIGVSLSLSCPLDTPNPVMPVRCF